MNLEQEHQQLKTWAEVEVCRYLATKVRRIRREAKESQAAFAERVGVPLRTYKRFETHGKASLETFVRILRAIERTQYLFMLFPQYSSSAPRPSISERLKRLTPTMFV